MGKHCAYVHFGTKATVLHRIVGMLHLLKECSRKEHGIIRENCHCLRGVQCLLAAVFAFSTNVPAKVSSKSCAFCFRMLHFQSASRKSRENSRSYKELGRHRPDIAKIRASVTAVIPFAAKPYRHVVFELAMSRFFPVHSRQ